MQLASYINDLLFRYECVIIPGFGAFLTQYHSARIDTITNTFTPPGKLVSFNRQLQTNDGLLANYIATIEKCSYETSLQRIRNFTGKLSLQLSEGKTVTIKNIGDFVLNKEHTIQFTPSESQNFNTASFGLTSFVSINISRETYQKTVAALEEKAPIFISPEKRYARPYLKYAAIALIAVSAIGFGGLKIYESSVQKHNFAEKQKANSLIDNQIQEATFFIDYPLPSLNLTVTKQTGKYHIIAGAFRVKENAEKKISQLSKQGFTANMIGVNKYGLHQVAYSSHKNRLEALQTLRKIKTSNNKDAWLLVLDLNK